MRALIYHSGEFGIAVAERLAETFQPGERIDLSLSREAAASGFPHLAQHDFAVVVSGRPYDAAMRSIDDACAEARMPWTSVVMSGSNMMIAPRYEAGVSCYHCLMARTDAHSHEGDRAMVLRAAYDRNPLIGPAGYIGPMRELAVAAINEAATGARRPGRFRQVDVVMGTIQESDLIALHDCRRCRPVPPDYDQSRRFVDRLVPELRKIRT